MDISLYLFAIFLSKVIIIIADNTVEVDEGKSRVIACPPRKVLHIKYASYEGKALFCKTNDVTSIVRSKCQSRRKCQLYANDKDYIDTCRGPNEELVVTYECRDDCFYRIKGNIFYNGSISITKSGRKCQWWDDDFPHDPTYRPKSGGQRNYCRNPDGDNKNLWCYTTDPETRWEYCDIQECEWTMHSTAQPVANMPTDGDDTPVAVILGALFGLLITSVVLVAVFLMLKRRGYFKSEEGTGRSNRTYIYTAPEHDATILARVRRLLRRNKKDNTSHNVLANNPGYLGMQGERIEAVDYTNAPLVQTRVYEMPNKENDQHGQTYTSLYDAPNSSFEKQIDGEYENTSVENQYEISQPRVQPLKPTVAIKPILKNPKPSPKPSPKPTPKPNLTSDNKNSENDAVTTKAHGCESNNEKDLAGTSVDNNKPKTNNGNLISPDAMKHSSSASSLVKLNIQKFNKS